MLDAMISSMVGLFHFVAHLVDVVAAAPVPNPGQGEEPPFAKPVMVVVRWGVWLALLAGGGGFIIVGANMTLKHKRGEGGGHVTSIVTVTAGVMLIVMAFGIVGSIVGISS